MIEPVDILAVGAHPDDVELGCGGSLAAFVGRGRRVGVLDLTRGEAGTRGTPEIRRREAAEAAGILGATFRETLDLGDGDLRTDREAQLAVIDVVRRARPRLVLAQHEFDRHPDHGRASRLVAEAAFYAGLRALETGHPPHRPQQVLFFPSSYDVRPTLLVDVTGTFDVKLAALRAYGTQFWGGGAGEAGAAGPETYVSSAGFLEGVAARARTLGRMANVPYAEGFVANLPPLIADPVSAFEGYEPGF